MNDVGKSREYFAHPPFDRDLRYRIYFVTRDHRVNDADVVVAIVVPSGEYYAQRIGEVSVHFVD